MIECYPGSMTAEMFPGTFQHPPLAIEKLGYAVDTTSVPERVPQATAWYGGLMRDGRNHTCIENCRMGCRNRAADLPASAHVPLSQVMA